MLNPRCTSPEIIYELREAAPVTESMYKEGSENMTSGNAVHTDVGWIHSKWPREDSFKTWCWDKTLLLNVSFVKWNRNSTSSIQTVSANIILSFAVGWSPSAVKWRKWATHKEQRNGLTERKDTGGQENKSWPGVISSYWVKGRELVNTQPKSRERTGPLKIISSKSGPITLLRMLW